MKRYICIVMALLMVSLTGCTLPFMKDNSAKQSSAASSTNTDPFAGKTANQAANANQTSIGNDTGAAASADLNGQTTTAAGMSNTGSVAGNGSADANASVLAASVSASSVSGAEVGNTADGLNAAATAKIAITVYYQDADGYLIPTTRLIDKQQGIARAAISGIIDGAIVREEIQYYGLYPVLPENTDVLGINVKDGLAVIDFNTKLLNYADKFAERNIIASIVYTLTEFDTIGNVRILVNGFPQQVLKYGTDISGLLNRDNIMINTREALNSTVSKADIYCRKKANEGFTYVLPVSYELNGEDKNQTMFAGQSPDILVRLLLRNHPKDPLLSDIPTGAALLGYTVKDGGLTLDLDAKFVKYAGNATEEGILKQLLYTIRQVKGISRVYLQVEGNKAELPEGTDISNGILVPKTVNDVIDR